MRINSNVEAGSECPEEKLKFISFVDQLQASTQALSPLTPERANKEWVMDAWDDHSQVSNSSPQTFKCINRMLSNRERKDIRLKKLEFLSERADHAAKQLTPIRELKEARSV
jgi:hypothetical protein